MATLLNTIRHYFKRNGGKNEALVIDDYLDSLIGITSDGRAVYDFETMVIEYARRNDASEQDAWDYIDYNVLNSLNPFSEIHPVVIYKAGSTWKEWTSLTVKEQTNEELKKADFRQFAIDSSLDEEAELLEGFFESFAGTTSDGRAVYDLDEMILEYKQQHGVSYDKAREAIYDIEHSNYLSNSLTKPVLFYHMVLSLDYLEEEAEYNKQLLDAHEKATVKELAL